MKPSICHLVALGVTVCFLAGCGESKTSQPPATGKQTGTDVASSNPQAEAGSRKNEGAPPNGGNEPGPAVPEPGEPGSIKGRLKSPYTRLAEGVVYIKRVDGVEFQLPGKNAVMDQKNLIFKPHVLPILAGATIDFPNSDTVRHNVFSRKDSTRTFNLGTYDIGKVKRVTFEKAGITHLGCNVHAEMSAYIVVCQNPYFAVTDRKGNFAIPKVPPGKWRLTFFHEKIRAKTLEAVVAPGEEAHVEFTNLKRK